MNAGLKRLSLLAGTPLVLLAAVGCSPEAATTPAGTASSSYVYQVTASGLTNPTSLALVGDSTLLVAHQPATGDASLARLDLQTGALSVQANGPTARSAFATNRAGRIYWVDGAKGALMTQDRAGGAPTVLESAGIQPTTTVAVDAENRVYIAGAATADGQAKVIQIRGLAASIPDRAGPDVTALAAASSGDLYWTGAQDGVIYHRASDGTGSVVLSGLDHPTAIALDPSEGVLYFTEVPTPGVAGSAGGRNTVNAIDLATSVRTVIHAGDPHPAGIAAAANGAVYWTSKTQGVVMCATPKPPQESGTSKFSATLTGANEVPAVVTKASGLATFSLATGNSDDHGSSSQKLTYKLALANLHGVQRVELRLGAPGAVGPLVALLSRGNDDGRDDDEHHDSEDSKGFATSGTLTSHGLMGPFAGKWSAFLKALAAGQLYVNVTTRGHSSGELRGQCLPVGTTPPPTAQPPTASITAPAGNVTIDAGQSVTFAGAASASDGGAVTVLWNFGDGTTSTSLSPGAHAYPMAGSYVVTLTATDSSGLSDPSPPSRTITVSPATTVNRAPDATITAPAANVSITAGQSVTFTGTASDPDGNMVTVLWNFGDGSTSTLLAPPAHTYATAGSYTVTLTATDSLGLADPTPATRVITVTAVVANAPPSAIITAPATNVTIVAGASVSFTGTATDPNGDTITALWTFGDGATSALLTAGPHVYAAAGTYTATLTVTDSKGAVDPNPPTRTITVTGVVVNAPPDATITAPAANVTIVAGASVSFTGTATDPNGNPVTVLWNFGDGTTSALLAPGAHVFATAGTYTVTLTATDSLGAVDPTPATRVITVTPVVAAAPTLTQVQAAVFNGCTGCHSAGGSAGLDLSAGQAYSNLVNVPATTFSGMRVVPGSPSTSALVTQLAGGHRSVSAANQKLIVDWITAGALNN